MKEKPVYLPGLNGIRTIAAMGVLLSHINLSLIKFNLTDYSLFGFRDGKPLSWTLGGHGVTMFFVLSGFLITFLLLKEYHQTNTIKVKDFYVRRILRIWPLYYFYIILTTILASSIIDFDVRYLYYLTFFANIPFVYSEAYPAMDHLWSISVEEQFYLFWPILFLFMLKRNFVRIIIMIITGLIIYRIYIWYTSPFSIPALFSIVNRFDSMMVGGLGAYLFFHKSKFITLINNKAIQIIAWGVVLAMVLNIFRFVNTIIEVFVITVVTLIIIIGQINIDSRIVNLENKLMSYLGKLSFGIYVYHPLVILMLSKILKYDKSYAVSELFFVILTYLIIVSTTIFVAHFSYYKFELRFLKLKHKFSVVKSTNDKFELNKR